MKIKYQVTVRDGEVVEEQILGDICCDDMRSALVSQETPLAKTDALPWLYCPFCKAGIEVLVI